VVRSRNARRGGGLGQKNPKPSRCGSVSGATCEMVMGDSAQGWWGGGYDVVMVVGPCARETRGREGIRAKNRNRAVVARFRARRVKMRWRVVHRGGGLVRAM
jgi:hypothetical protein